ncbi:MAG TPA: VacJ family lipoprotein [Spongiibacteraceae bacterium]|nr:VacJ family lipoprotein [Spongiibacteraceae bacterium]
MIAVRKNKYMLRFASLLLAVLIGGCAATPPQQTSLPERQFPELENAPPDPHSIIAIDDPFEKFNRTMYNFNARFDRYVFLPVVSGYETVMPNFAQQGVTNFFNNLREVKYFINNLAQAKLTNTGVTLGRFVINSTIGIAGLWDPATHMGLYVRREDFGQTLGYWGVGSGPYLVLPIFGPSSVRDAGGLAFDFAVDNEIDLLNVNDDANKDGIRIALTTLKAIDTRKNTKFRYYETGSPFEYTLVRFAYLRMREVQVDK